MMTHSRQRTWSFPGRLLEDHLGLALIAWGALVAVVAATIAGVATVSTISRSGWEMAAAAPPWFAAFIGGYLTNSVLPLHVAHGQTRRDFAIELVILSVLFTAALAILMAIGFLLETLLYRVMDWPRVLSEDHLFTSTTQVPLIFTEFWLTFLTWFGAGAFVAAAWYRSDGEGLIALVPALIPIAITGTALGDSWGPVGFVLGRFFEPASPPLALAIPICIASFLLTLAMTWPVVRDIPLRSKSD